MSRPERLPVLFVSHGSPLFAVEPGLLGPQLLALGRQLPPPRAVLVLSPHWRTAGLEVTTADRPATVHDFGGFPQALYELRYPARGSAAVAHRTLERLKADGWDATGNDDQGLDHGAWVPLLHLYPEAHVPVVQVSMPHSLDAHGALRLGRSLAPLADEGVLIVGSGSITHNLFELRRQPQEDAAYAAEFVAWARGALRRRDTAALVDYLRTAPHAGRAHPTSEHYLPLPFACGAAGAWDDIHVLDGGMTYGTLAMDAYVLSRDPAP